MIKVLISLVLLVLLSGGVYADPNTAPNLYYSEQGVLNRAYDRTRDSLSVNLIGKDIGHGQVTCSKGARRISGDVDIIELKIRPLLTNTSKIIYIGGSGVTADNGYMLLSNDTELPLTLRVDNTSDVYISPDIGGSGVSFIYTIK